MATKNSGSLKGVDVVLVTSINLAAEVGGSVLPVANGGNGTGSFTDGQILIGSTSGGNTLVKTTLTGTSNQVVVTNGAGAITLSLPQSIATTSSPQFTQLGLGRTANLLGAGSAVSVSNASFSACELIRSTATTTGDIGAINFFNGTTQVVSFAVRGDSATDSGAFEIWTKSTSPGTLTRRVTCTSAGNFAVGSTSPLGKFESRDATGASQISASYDATNACYLSVTSSGQTTISTAGTNAGITLTPTGTGKVILSAIPRFNGTNSTGAGSSLLGANSPATTLTSPYTWISVITSDGSTAYIPCWK
jgi:hypothetical protein